MIGVAIFEDKAISECNLNDTAAGDDTSSVGTIFAIPNIPVERKEGATSADGDGSVLAQEDKVSLTYYGLLWMVDHKPGTINFPPDGYKVQYPGNNNMITTPITFRANSEQLAITEFVRLPRLCQWISFDRQQEFGFPTPLKTTLTVCIHGHRYIVKEMGWPVPRFGPNV